MELPGDMPVTLVIKAPSQRMDDQVIDCVLSWTVRKLKEHLERVYPSKPKCNEQRLIYSGRLLQEDTLMLKDIFKQPFDNPELDNRYTLHLVCSSDSLSSKKMSPSTTKAVNTTSVPPVPSSTRSTTSPVSTPSSSDGLRHRGNPQPEPSPVPPTSTYPGAYGYPGFSPPAGYPSYGAAPGAYDAAGAYNQDQYSQMMMQQMYSQYMMQYMQYYQGMYSPEAHQTQPYMQQAFPSWMAQAPPPAAPQAPANNIAAAAAAAPRQGVRMNAQGGMVADDDDDDGEPRDWLHHTYFLMRFLTFMAILFFYSNVTRFLVVFSGSFLIYFLQKLRKYMQKRDREIARLREEQERQQQEDNQPENENEYAHAGQNVDGPVDAGAGEAANEDNSPQDQNPTNDQQPPEDQNEGRVARTFGFFVNTLQAFFTSLIPTPPELLEAN